MNFLAILDQPDQEWASLFNQLNPVDVPECWATGPHRALYTERAEVTGLAQPELYCMVKKTVVSPDEMSAKQREIYDELRRDPKFEENIVWMKTQTLSDLIGAPSDSSQRVSGRVVDSLMTKYPRFEDVHYYIDVTDRAHTRYVSRLQYWAERNTGRTGRYILFNISSAYRSHMNLYSKTFFDPFGRGVEVLHQMKSGEHVTFSMCKLMFYMWARKYHVFDFLRDKYEHIAQIQREDQQRQRVHRIRKRRLTPAVKSRHKPKRKYRNVVGTLCPADGGVCAQIKAPANKKDVRGWFQNK